MPNGWGGRLKKVRQAEEITIAKLARVAKVSEKTIGRLERGMIRPSEVTKKKILAALTGISNKSFKMNEIFPEESEKHESIKIRVKR